MTKHQEQQAKRQKEEAETDAEPEAQAGGTQPALTEL